MAACVELCCTCATQIYVISESMNFNSNTQKQLINAPVRLGKWKY